MPTLQAASIADLAYATFNAARKGDTAWNDIASTRTRYVALPEILKKQSAKFSDGPAFTWDLLAEAGDSARMHGLFNTANVGAKNVLAQATGQWRHCSVDYGFDEHEQVLNSGAGKIVDAIKARDAAYMINLHEKIESQFWAQPTSASDDTSLWGVFYWIVWNAVTSGGDFLGGIPTGFATGSTVAGVDPTTLGANGKGFRNYTDTFLTISQLDAIDKLRQAFYKTGWSSPVPGVDPKGLGNFKLYTVYQNVKEMELLLTQQNDNLGNDVASKDGMVKIRGFPVIPVPYLDDVCATSRPFFGIDWEIMFPAILKGFFMRRKIWQSATQPFVTNVTVTLSFNIGCYSRRRLFVVAKSDPALS